jgi:hypothetical protein
MHDSNQSNRKPNANAINQLEIDGLLMENLELRDRVADLESERDSYRELLQRSLDVLNVKAAEMKHQDTRISDQRQTIRELREVIGHLERRAA